MPDSLVVNDSIVRLVKGDITDLEIESFVYYARHDLQLGSGFGTAITQRGGSAIQEELAGHGELPTTQVVISGAGNLKARSIIHAVGPRFQEEDLTAKLRATVLNCLTAAEQKGLKQIAFPAMGAGFYGVSLETSAEVTLQAVRDYLAGDTDIEEVVICLLDNREYAPFRKKLTESQMATPRA